LRHNRRAWPPKVILLNKMKKILIIIGVIVLVIAGLVVWTVWSAGEFKTVTPFSAGPCQVVDGLLGSEDITIDRRTGMAFISSCDFRAMSRAGNVPRGAIYGYDLTAADPVLTEFTKDFPHEFNPHGIGLFQGPDGIRLFVINHRSDGHFVEVFDYQGGKLVYRQSIHDELMRSPNDLCPVDEERFYVTNDHGWASGLGRTLEDFLQLPLADVLYYDGKKFIQVADGLRYANGVAASADGKRLYVGETVGRKLRVYDRQENGRLNEGYIVDLDTGVDNIELDENGDLWIGAHPKLLTYVRYAGDPARKAPCQILRVSLLPDEGFLAVEEHVTDGSDLSGSSVGAVYRDMLLIGSVMDDKFLVCKRK
jgi:arylesterase/paraoxonase